MKAASLFVMVAAWVALTSCGSGVQVPSAVTPSAGNSGGSGSGGGGGGGTPPGPTPFMYAGNIYGNAVYVCSTNTGGTLNTCATTGGESWNAAQAVVQSINGTNYAYVADTSNHNIWVCSVSATNGTLSGCATSDAGESTWQPTHMTFQVFGGTTYAYIADATGSVWQCSINANGTLNSCATTPSSSPPSWTPTSVVFQSVNGTTYGYVSDEGGNLWVCTLNGSGGFTSCSHTPASGAPSWETTFIAFYTTGGGTTYAYVGDVINNKIWQCSMNTDGTLDTCTSAASGFQAPWSGAFETINGTTYLYVGDSSSFLQCSINTSTGSLTGCLSTDAGESGNWVYGISFFTGS
jgi:hypothetical protein